MTNEERIIREVGDDVTPFAVIVRGLMTEEVVDAIAEAAPDSLLSIDRDEMGGIVELECEMSMESLEEVLSTVDALERIPGIEVERLEPDELVFASEIAERVARSRQNIDQLVQGLRGPGGFPTPVSHATRRNPLWRWSQVEKWFADYEGRSIDEERQRVLFTVAALNSMLEIRRFRPWVEKERLRKILATISQDDVEMQLH